MERWQIQDRLAARLRGLGVPAPRFYEAAGGRLAFKIRGRQLSQDLVERLQAIDALHERAE